MTSLVSRGRFFVMDDPKKKCREKIIKTLIDFDLK